MTTGQLPVDPGNRDQRAAWDGDEGAFWAEHARTFERSSERYDPPFWAAAAVEPDSRVLDVGCGTGRTTRDAARLATGGSALGVDLSAAMLRVARDSALREGLTNVSFEQADAQIHPFAARFFDVALAHSSAMFFADKTAAFANLHRALRPGGRLVLLVWQPLPANEWMVEIGTALRAGRELPVPPADAPHPFSLGDPSLARDRLAAAGFQDVDVQGVSAPMWFGGTVPDTLEFLLGAAGWLLEGLDDDERSRAVDDLTARIEAHRGPEGVTFGSAGWLVTAHRGR
ncbi:class I SAM-dependent methyltransferase [Nocardioides panacis]|uniref:Class I SAM-dependent methyltransferase n=1 Tax=Nocardioides panacis TaxID=2849501 RepID=A0A975SZD9_9ACTN|nr:class I SAM-dependent methyltransferase [Nocardioides panacis]QWZ08747.1 class I SAM-dependent methyltransferase [Nocardioides panacis]